VIREGIPQPHFWMMCDGGTGCGLIIQMLIDPAQPEQALQVSFIQQAVQQGWTVGLDRQMCPAHNAAKKAEQPMVLLANGRMPLPKMRFQG
jgi:hypothetical protein